METFLIDFVGAAQLDGSVIYISSEKDDGMDCRSLVSILDVLSSSDEESEDIAMMTRCVGKQLADPIPLPSSSTKPGNARAATPRSLFLPQPNFDREYVELDRGNGPIQRDDRVRGNQPNNLCAGTLSLASTRLYPLQ